MDTHNLSELIDDYIREFERLNADKNTSTIKVFLITSQLQRTLGNKKADFSNLNKQLHCSHPFFSPRFFEAAFIETLTLVTFLTLNTFITVVARFQYKNINDRTKELINYLLDYQQKALIPGLKHYKMDCLLINNQAKVKQQLSHLTKEFKQLTQKDITQHRIQCMKEKLDKKDKEHSISDVFGATFTGSAKTMATETFCDVFANDDFHFLYQLEALCSKKNVSYLDVYRLKQASSQFKTAILQLPSVTEVTHFHWIINLIINSLNQFINCVESQKSKDIKNICDYWQKNWIDVAENEVNQMDRKIYLR